ncbi:phage virion morphogenesis protein, partial [Pseudomonas aeruginosa]|uniref:phage virion morphogenesis protein n=1 Tax=Pseudomonas aeruginosa TaxID=287 RepID=UPI003AB08F50
VAQRAPDGTPWAALSPRYQARKRRNRDKILTASGDLRKLAGQVEGDTCCSVQTFLMALSISSAARSDVRRRQSAVYFRMNERTGEVGRQFVPKRRSNFAQDVRIGPYTITMPARPWLGTSDTDDAKLLQRVMSLHKLNLAELAFLGPWRPKRGRRSIFVGLRLFTGLADAL